MIHFTNAGHTFKNGTVGLADINLQIDAGEFVYIVGESGAGKSTLTKLVLRELVATQGTIRVDGIFGSGTESATKTWQSKHGLAADGIVGKMTWQSLKNAACHTIVARSASFSRTSVCSPTARPGRTWLLPVNALACRVVRL